MTPKQLIRGLVDIANEKIPISCIYDMIPEIIEHLKASEEQNRPRAE